MTTQQMNYFITTVKHLNITEAAENLNMTQPALSRSILSMEKELGVTLFVRDKRKKLRLTAEGSAVYQHLTRIYAAYEKMMLEVDKVRKGLDGKLKIGFLDGQMLGRRIKEILDQFSAEHPNIELEFFRDTEHGLIKKLHQQKLDVAVMLELQVKNSPDLLFNDLFRLTTYMIAAKDHPFAGREDVAITDLRNDTFIYTRDSEITNLLITNCRKAGFEPHMIYVDDIQTQSLYLEMGKGIAGYNEYHTCFYSPNVSTFRVKEIPGAQFVAVWSKSNYNPAIAMLNKQIVKTNRLS